MTSSAALPPVSPPRVSQASASRWAPIALWLASAAVATAGLAWLAQQLKNTGRMPEVLFQIALGLALGQILAWRLPADGWRPGRWVVAATFVCGLATVAGQELFRYYDLRQDWLAELNHPTSTDTAHFWAAQLQPAGLIEPPSLGRVMAADIQRRGWGFCIFDLLATSAPAAWLVARRRGFSRGSSSAEPASDTPQVGDGAGPHP